jgi:hypothetical protein
MAHREKYIEARKLRAKGMPYSEIKNRLGVGKGTLSAWLRDMPLSRERINELRATSPRRIERYRMTMESKRNARLAEVYARVARNIGTLTNRELFIAGLFLYWGEGGKTKRYSITLSNTDPAMIRFYIKWLGGMSVPRPKIKIRLQLYADMNISKETHYWQRVSNIPTSQIQKPYIKKNLYAEVIQKGFGHGTCNVIVDERDTSEYVLQSLKLLSNMFSDVLGQKGSTPMKIK